MDTTVQVTTVSDPMDQSSNPLHTGEMDKLMSSSVPFVGLAYQGKDIMFRFIIECILAPT
jgi:hypothetical protein